MAEQVWRYEKGNWSRMASPVEFYDEEGEPLDAPGGYSAYTRSFGDPGEFEVEVYSTDPESGVADLPPYLAMVYNVGNNVERIFLDDFPSLLQLLRELAPVLDIANRGWEPEEDLDLDGDGEE